MNMKRIILLLAMLISLTGYSQSGEQKIKNYLDKNYSKLGLTKQDVNDWILESEASSESTGIYNYYVKQRHQGIKVFRNVSNFWIKNNEVINGGKDFVQNLSQKINTVTPMLNVTDALVKVFKELNEIPLSNVAVIENNKFNYKLKNGNLNEDPINAELVYQIIDANSLRLAWDYNFYTQDYKHLWSIRIDAVSGKLLEKNDMVISCSFESHNNFDHDCQKINLFNKNFFKEDSNSIKQVLGGGYRVVPYNYFSPNHFPGERTLVTNPENSIASPKGWHDTNSLTGVTPSLRYAITRGNNVWARNDFAGTNTVVAPNGTSPTGSGTFPNLTFDFPYPGTNVAANTYIDAANTNLFYMNNIMHDVWYQYGFDQASGNFQQNTYGVPNSSGSDGVIADAQDQSGVAESATNRNNANFSTPADGQAGRMQMYLWTYRPIKGLLNVNSPSDIAGLKIASDNGFNPGHVDVPTAPAMIETDLVLFDDGSPDVGQTDNADACSPAVNAAEINGKIVVIRRSTSTNNGGIAPCSFTLKAVAAQAAGAVAVVIVNNDSTAPNNSIGMSGADATITIPVISISLNNGEAIISKLKSGIVVNAKIQSDSPLNLFVNTDGDFDNGIIAHEYGHGISTRLTGGRNVSTCLQNYDQTGEGWSDWFALMMQIKPSDVGTTPTPMATFAQNQPNDGRGLRSFPYSTDMTVNPLTFKDSNSPIPTDPASTGYRYVNGDFWATTLWDLTWAYIGKYGFDANIYTGTGGNNRVMRIVLDGLKLQPCSPTVIDSRDAIIAADQATTNGADYCLITEVFRRRGVGLNASSGSRDDCNDQVEDFTAFPAGSNCVNLGVNYFENENMVKVYPSPSNGKINIKINQFVGKINLQVVDLNGRVVYSQIDNDFNAEKTIDLSDLESGIYIINIEGDQLNFNKKIIIN